MSAYVVAKKTIDNVVTGIKRAQNDRRCQYPKYWGDKFDLSDPDYLGKRLWDLNRDAVEQRYHDGDFESVPYTFTENFFVTRVQILKSIKCFLYQCSEGDVPETSDLYKDLENFSNALAHYIVSDLPEYEKADWG